MTALRRQDSASSARQRFVVKTALRRQDSASSAARCAGAALASRDSILECADVIGDQVATVPTVGQFRSPIGPAFNYRDCSTAAPGARGAPGRTPRESEERR